MTELDIMQDSSEVIHYDRPGIPLYIRTARLASYPNMQALCHWHDDVEMVYIREGQMNYYINGARILLKEHDGIVINARQMHYGYAYMGQDCEFSCILFHPGLFTGNKELQKDYVTPILENPGLEYWYLDSREAFGQEMVSLLARMVEQKEMAVPGYEIQVVGLMHLLWGRLLSAASVAPDVLPGSVHPDLAVQKDMVSYIRQHYGEKLTLADIAASGHVCRSKCCSIFKQYLQQSPIEFLNSYRMKVSCNLLQSTEKSITEIALTCGFNHLSYFSKLFWSYYGCTPGEYRKKISKLSMYFDEKTVFGEKV